MFSTVAKLIIACSLGATACSAQTLSAKWEDLTSPDFTKAIAKAQGVCMLPMGDIEDWGPSGPLGVNLYLDRDLAEEAAKQEYAVIFPTYFVGGANDVSTRPGAISYSPHLQLEVLDETIQEMGRNGCKKILIVNGHSGNNGLLSFYISESMGVPHDYVLYSMYGPDFRPVAGLADFPKEGLPSKPGADGHGGEERISGMLVYHPDLVHLDRAHDVSGTEAEKLPLPQGVSTGIRNMAERPHGYEGDASGATAVRGKILFAYNTGRVVKALRAIKADDDTLRRQREFFSQRAKQAGAAWPLTNSNPESIGTKK